MNIPFTLQIPTKNGFYDYEWLKGKSETKSNTATSINIILTAKLNTTH